MELGKLMARYDSLVVLDVETSGLHPQRNEIIELAAARVEGGEVVERYDQLLRLSAGTRLDRRITELTGITREDLEREGIPKEAACRDLQGLLSHGKTLLAAYNAQFDLAFLYHFLLRGGDPSSLDAADFLDALTIFKDRRPYPHKLCNAIEAYGLGGRVVNSHRAIDDVLATVEVLAAMAAERDDLVQYINLFGFHPKYGVSGRPLAKVRYAPQPYGSPRPLYETIRPTATPLAGG